MINKEAVAVAAALALLAAVVVAAGAASGTLQESTHNGHLMPMQLMCSLSY